MGFRVIWSEDAVQDLRTIRHHYRETRGEDSAVLVMNDIYSRVDRLQELPLVQGTRLHGSTRVLHHPPYLIHYRTDEVKQAVYIRRIKDGRRAG